MANGPLHIVHGVLALNMGGLERIVVDLVRVYRRRGHRVSVLCLEERGMLAPIAETAGATVVSLDKAPGRKPRAVVGGAETLARLRPDVIHTHALGALWHLGPTARELGIPIIHTAHNDHFRRETGLIKQLKLRLLYREATKFAGRFCGVAEPVTASCGRWGTVKRSKLTTVLNGIDTEIYEDKSSRSEIRALFSIPPTARVVGSVGRLVDVKRQDLLIRAVAELGSGYEDVHLLLVGDGAERPSLEELTRSLGLTSRIHFAGFQQAPQRYYAAMDAFASSSRIEGLPLAVLESWAAGLPVVSTAVGGVPKLVKHGETGLLVPFDDVPALRDALRTVLSDPAKARSMAEAGQRLVREQYSLERMATEYERHYESLVVERRGAC